MGGAIRRRRDASGRVDFSDQRRRQFEAVLRPVGLWELFNTLPRRIQEHFWRSKSPDPLLEFDATFPCGLEHRELRRTLESGFRDAVVEIDGVPINARDFVAVVIGCTLVVRGTKLAGMPEVVVRFMREAGRRLEALFAQELANAISAIYDALHVPMIAHSRLDVRIFNAMCDYVTTAGGKVQPRARVGCAMPQVRSVRLDGMSRPMFRVGRQSLPDVKWISWTGEMIGRGELDREYPVFVQSHALRQLHRRVNHGPMAPFLEVWLAECLEAPNIVDRRGDHLLVEYRIKDYRLGYLVVTLLEDVAAVRTFKFLTMSNTPEARMLERQLRLTRREVDWLGLDDLTTFTQTDLRGDPLLRDLLDRCGCGHLLSLSEDEDFSPSRKAFATQMRRFLGLAA